MAEETPLARLERAELRPGIQYELSNRSCVVASLPPPGLCGGEACRGGTVGAEAQLWPLVQRPSTGHSPVPALVGLAFPFPGTLPATPYPHKPSWLGHTPPRSPAAAQWAWWGAPAASRGGLPDTGSLRLVSPLPLCGLPAPSCRGRAGLGVASDRAGPSTEQQAASKAQREQELAASAFQELDDDMDGL